MILTASALAWLFGVIALALLVLLLIALGGNADLAAENRRLRMRLVPAHPSARKAPR